MTTNNTVLFPAVNGNPINVDTEIANLRAYNVDFDTMLQTFVSANIHKNLADYHIREICRIYGKNKPEIKNGFRNAENNQKKIKLIGSLPIDAEDFVEKYIKHNNYTVDFDNQFQIGNDVLSLRDVDNMASHIIAESNKCNLHYKIGDIKHYTNEYLKKEKHFLVQSYKDRIAYDNRKCAKSMKEALDFKLNELASILTDKNIAETAVVLHHWMWQVKRKLFNLPVTDHMMVVLFGNQGCGKSYFIKKFTSPLEKFTTDVNLMDVTDSKAINLREDYYILVVDEMAKANKTEINELKRIVTAGNTATRQHYSHGIISGKQNSTLIGSTNKALASILFDNTGMRRFFEINCLDELDWDKVNNFDYITLWKLVNENEDSPYNISKDIFQNVKDIQEELISQEPLETFIIETIMNIINKGSKNIRFKLLQDQFYLHKVGSREFYSDYKQWSLDNGYHPYNVNNFKTNLLTNVTKTVKGLKISHNRRSEGMFYFIEYNSEFLNTYNNNN